MWCGGFGFPCWAFLFARDGAVGTDREILSYGILGGVVLLAVPK
jgi:hypothetical protein